MARAAYLVLDSKANKITNVADPTNAQDAATKAYVDNKSVPPEVIVQASEPTAGATDILWVDIDDTSIASSPFWRAWTGTQAAYDAIPTKDSGTLYVVVG